MTKMKTEFIMTNIKLSTNKNDIDISAEVPQICSAALFFWRFNYEITAFRTYKSKRHRTARSK